MTVNRPCDTDAGREFRRLQLGLEKFWIVDAADAVDDEGGFNCWCGDRVTECDRACYAALGDPAHTAAPVLGEAQGDGK